jgi:hypothetical protein
MNSLKEGFEHESERKMPKTETEIKIGTVMMDEHLKELMMCSCGKTEVCGVLWLKPNKGGTQVFTVM